MSVRRSFRSGRPWGRPLLALGLATAMVVASCGDDDDEGAEGAATTAATSGASAETSAPASSDTTSAASTSAASTSAAATTTEAAADFDPNATIRYGMDFELGIGPTLDPAHYNSNPTALIGNHIYGTMIRR